MSEKKIATFEQAVNPPEVGRRCILTNVRGHYNHKLNDGDVITSFVVAIRDGGRTIETKNTIYEQRAAPARYMAEEEPDES